ncbi:MAG TPA: DNA alkylation repair protein [Gemmatimonadaceae bacterium]|nr:DNA alkylation repair protein [Gemmatimonadaceae bacterium]
MASLSSIRKQLRAAASPARRKVNEGYFKTGPGEYAEGDKFIGLSVPFLRGVAREHRDMSLSVATSLLKSAWHEERLLALIVLVRQYQKGDERMRAAIYALYMRSTRFINNWDLVDLSAEHIVGPHLPPGKRAVLVRLAKSKDLWERRIAMLSTFHYIRQKKFDDALRIATILLGDDEDLIHKAVGWMLREIGNRDRAVEERFLVRHAKDMPRTMLRYAIERFPEPLRRKYLSRA